MSLQQSPGNPSPPDHPTMGPLYPHGPLSLARERGSRQTSPAATPHGGPSGSGGGGILSGLGLYLVLIQAQVSAQARYRASFVMQALSQFAVTFSDLLTILLLFQRFPSIAGWTMGEVAFLYGLGGMAFGISDLLCGGFDSLSKMIRLGTFDRVLTRPVGTFGQVLTSDIQIRRLGRVIQGIVTLSLALSWLDVVWTAPKVLVLLSGIVGGVVIFTAIWVIGAAVTFWTVETSEVTNVFTYGGEALVSYPMPIYAEGIRRFFTYVVPLVFVSYLPALYILERPDPLGLPPFLQLCSPIAAIVFLLV